MQLVKGAAGKLNKWREKKYLRRTVVPLAELRLGSTFVLVNSSVKSRCLVPSMRTNATRLHQGFRREDGESVSPSAALPRSAPSFPACTPPPPPSPPTPPPPAAPSPSVHDVSGSVGSKCALLIGSGRRKWAFPGAAGESRDMEVSADGGGEGFLGYSFFFFQHIRSPWRPGVCFRMSLCYTVRRPFGVSCFNVLCETSVYVFIGCFKATVFT